jgi:hypothetical protein
MYMRGCESRNAAAQYQLHKEINMSTTPIEMQIQSTLDRAVSLLGEIRSDRRADRLFDVLEIVRDGVNELSREHETIRADIRELTILMVQQQGAD